MMFQKLDKAIKLPFTDEIEDSMLPKDLVEAGKKFFSNIMRDKNNIINPSETSKYFEDLINQYYPKVNDFFPTKNLVSSTTEPIIAKLYNMDLKKNDLGKVNNFIYLGVLFKGEENYVKIRTKISDGLKILKDNLNIENDEIDHLINLIKIVKEFELPSNWKFPHKAHKNLWHSTLLFKGNKSINEIQNDKSYLQFKEGEINKVKFIGLVYIPNRTIVMIIKFSNGIVSNNKYPHVTAFINQYPPKASNDVLEKILLNEDDLEKYNNIIKENTNEGEFIKKYDIKINKENVVGYLILFEKSVEIEGIMHAFE